MRPTKAIEVELGGRKRRLAFDFNALRYLHDAAGLNALEDGLDLSACRTPGKMLVLVTAMLQSDAKLKGEALTEDQVGAMLDFEGIVEVTRAIEQVVAGSVPESAGDPPEAAAPSPGSSSGPSAATTSASPTTSSAN